MLGLDCFAFRFGLFHHRVCLTLWSIDMNGSNVMAQFAAIGSGAGQPPESPIDQGAISSLLDLQSGALDDLEASLCGMERRLEPAMHASAPTAVEGADGPKAMQSLVAERIERATDRINNTRRHLEEMAGRLEL